MANLQEYKELWEYKKRKAETEAKAEKFLRNKNLQQLGELKSYWTGVSKENRKMDEESVRAQEESSLWIRIIEKIMRARATDESGEADPTIEKTYLSLSEAAKFLNISESTLYKRTSSKEIPHFKSGKKLAFNKTDLEKYVAATRVKTQTEIDDDAAKFVANSNLKKRKK